MAGEFQEILHKLHLLTTEELKDLNHQVVGRLRSQHETKVQQAMAQFHVGQWVKFHHRNRWWYGRIVTLNTTTASVKCPSEVGRGGNWRVHPSFLTAMTEVEIKQQEKAA